MTKFIPRAEKRVSLETKMKKILDSWKKVTLSKTKMWTRKNQYVAEFDWKKIFSQVFVRLMTKIFKKI